MNTQALPAALAEIVDDFQALTEPERLQLLLEFSQGLPELPDRLKDHPELLEQVVECQSPLFLTIETEKHDAGSPESVRLFFKAPPEAPTTRGFAGVLHEGLDGLTRRGDPGGAGRHARAAGPHPCHHSPAHAGHDGHAGPDQAQGRRLRRS